MHKTLPAMLLMFELVHPPAHAEDGVAQVATVTVSAAKAPVIRKLDKTVHDVADAPRAANGSAQDVLQSVPGVSVTADGQIAVKGSPQVTVLVDGKPAAMLAGSGEERAVALQTMSGADIAGVEVITNPSAAYDANGGAVVNIVLKRNRKPGARGQLQGSMADQGLWNAGASGDLTRGRVSLHGNLALRRDATLKIRGSDLAWSDPSSGDTGQTTQSSRVFVRRTVESAALGLDVALGDTDTLKETLSLSGRYASRRSRPLFDVFNRARTGSDETEYHRISEGPNEQSDDSASLAYSRQDRGTALKAAFQHGATDALVDKSYRDVFVLPQRATAYSHGATRSVRRLDQATLDWTRAPAPGTGRHQWGMGLDFRRQTDAIGNYQASVDPASGIETPDPRTTNGYAVRTLLAAAYLTDRIGVGPWEALLGGRVERMALRVEPAGGIAATSRWRGFNPSLHLKREVGDAASLTLAYRRSLQRLDARDLNPFTTYVDAQNLSRGNPGLRPQRVETWEIGADAQSGKRGGSLGAFRRTSRDTVFDARSVAGAAIVTSKQNGGMARSTGMTASLEWTPATTLRLDADGGVYRVQLATPAGAGIVRQDGVSGYVNVKAAWRAGPDDVSLDAHGQSSSIVPLGRQGATGSVNLAWKRRLSATLGLTVNANDIFDGSRRSYRTDTATFRQAGYEHFVGRRIYVGFVKTLE